MKTIKLYGDMGAKFGREFNLDVKSPAEAIRALCAQVPGFRAYLHQHARDYYKIFVGGRNTSDKDELRFPCSDKEIIRIAPVLQGASGAARVVVGVILIALSFIPSPFSPYLFSAGVSMVIGGVIQMLTPVPKMGVNDGPNERPENKPSFNFDGPVNTTAQGHPVPLAYGHLIVGSAVISAGLTTA